MAAGSDTILALDVGNARIGIALAHVAARIPHPIGAVPHDEAVFNRLREFCEQEGVAQIVVGLPRGLEGQETAQTGEVRAFGARLEKELSIPFAWQDEAVTSVQAEAELQARRKPYTKQDIDALAATYILGDYLNEKL